MENIKCKTCGGSVTRVGNYYVCEWCRNKWEIDSGNDIHAVERANAWAALRDGDFEKAARLFEEIILKDGNSHEAYWGRALALGGIIYVNDIVANKKIPTCNNITEDSFIKGKDVQKAISLAPADIAEGYRKQAEYIEKVRIEWLEKASKEPAYDVFISFKDSDREHGIERTQDSVDAQDLYNALVAEGYKVFFSRISLRDKISEQYEPYIYNALKTAKVMIVFGEKAEYFNAVWLKNEWSRFAARIAKGEKHKNSLVVVYKNMNPGDLPVTLRSRQCLNAADMTFLSDLNRHIKRVIAESQQAVRLERIEIVGGERATRATKISQATVEVRTIGEGIAPELTISEKQTLELAMEYAQNGKPEKATELVENLLFENPNSVEALLVKIQIECNVSSETDLIKAKTFKSFSELQKILSIASKAFATKILNLCYNMRSLPDQEYGKILHIILPYAYDERKELIEKQLFPHANKTKGEAVFDELIATLDVNDVDGYIERLKKFTDILWFAKKESTQKYTIKILEVDPSNSFALKKQVEYAMEFQAHSQTFQSALEMLLKYSTNTNNIISWVIKCFCNLPATDWREVECLQALKYYKGDLEQLETSLIDISSWLIRGKLFEKAEYYLKLVLGFNKNNVDAFKNLFLLKAKVTDVNKLAECNIKLEDIPEFDKFMSMIPAEERKQYFNIARLQKYAKYRAARPIVCGLDHVVALRNDGTVVATGGNNYNQCNVSSWRDIIMIACGNSHTVGLKSDGTVVYAGNNKYHNCSDWRNITYLACTDDETFGVRNDGSVVVTGNSYAFEECKAWKDIAYIATSSCFVCGVKFDGSVVFASKIKDCYIDVSKWKDIVFVACGDRHVIGIQSDGAIITSGDDEYNQCIINNAPPKTVYAVGGFSFSAYLNDQGALSTTDKKACQVCHKTNQVVYICNTSSEYFALKSDGTIYTHEHSTYKECEDWTDITFIACLNLCLIGLKSNGQIVMKEIGDDKKYRHAVMWENVIQPPQLFNEHLKTPSSPKNAPVQKSPAESIQSNKPDQLSKKSQKIIETLQFAQKQLTTGHIEDAKRLYNICITTLSSNSAVAHLGMLVCENARKASPLNAEEERQIVLQLKHIYSKELRKEELPYARAIVNYRISGITLLHYACALAGKESTFVVIRMLIDMGADVNAITNHNITPLWYVCCGHAAYPYGRDCYLAAELLLKHGASINVTAKSKIDLFNPSTPEPIKKLILQKYPNAKPGRAKAGCYVATCIYGSYDCPEVWTLRRFRDNTLHSTWYGRLFIRLYYAVSPTLVKWFGKTKWFQRFWKRRLDKIVKKLHANGVKNTPYYDRDDI